MPILNFILILIAVAVIAVLINRGMKGSGFFSFPGRSKYGQSALVSVLLNLPAAKTDELLQLYKAEFGKGPAQYARKTINKWKSGRVQPATQTYRRFLIHLPKVMSYDMKCEVLRHFMQEFATKSNYKLDVHTDDWKEKLDPMIEEIIGRAYTARLPLEVENKLRWLGDGDMQAAQNILRASQIEESRIMVATLHEEFANLELLLSQDNLKPRVTHVLKFPYGTIELEIKRR